MPVSEAQFLAWCEASPALRLERSADGETWIAPPADLESDSRNEDVTVQLGLWSRQTRRGRTSTCSALFRLADGSAFSPDAAWTSHERLATLSASERRGFPRLCPEFVVEVMCPNDQLAAAQQKMGNWIANGALLGWLIDGDARRVCVYRPSRDAEIATGDYIDGEGPVAGFRLNLTSVWDVS